jgi:hypothetical protein
VLIGPATTNQNLGGNKRLGGKTYLQDLLTTSATVNQNTPLKATYINQAVTGEGLEEEPPYILDIQLAIQSMNNNKSPDSDNIPAELYKTGGGLLLNKIHSNRIWKEEKMSTDWTPNIIVLICIQRR